jgi:hypothetical protein
MQRREFLSASLAASAAAFSKNLAAQSPASTSPASQPCEYYLLRRYHMVTGPQTKQSDTYFSTALLPALTRLGLGPIGVFRLDYGPETPATYVLVPSTSIETLATLDLHLAEDAEFLAAAAPFWNAPATTPAFLRVESSLLAAFTGWPHITPPASAATKAKRIFQMRTYESPTFGDHIRKVEMFHSGEFEIFANAGFHPTFFGDMLIGPQMPCLTYMLSFENLAEMDAKWDLFRNSPDWHKLSSSTRFGFEAIVSNVTNLVLSPLAESQI